MDPRGGHNPGKPLVLQCAFSGTRNAAFDDIAPDFLRGSHALDFTDFDVGWCGFCVSLYKAAILAGLSVPKLLRAVPRHDMDQAAVARMVVERGFFSKRMNATGGGQAAELDSRAGRHARRRPIERPAVDKRLRRIGDPPRAPLSSADEQAALMTPPSRRTDQQRALVEARQNLARQMRLAIEEWTTKNSMQRARVDTTTGDFQRWKRRCR